MPGKQRAWSCTLRKTFGSFIWSSIQTFLNNRTFYAKQSHRFIFFCFSFLFVCFFVMVFGVIGFTNSCALCLFMNCLMNHRSVILPTPNSDDFQAHILRPLFLFLLPSQFVSRNLINAPSSWQYWSWKELVLITCYLWPHFVSSKWKKTKIHVVKKSYNIFSRSLICP